MGRLERCKLSSKNSIGMYFVINTLSITILDNLRRKSLFIDCRELQKAASDSQLIGTLARQVGYWPVFTFLNSVNNLIDLASVGLIGQKSACMVYSTLQPNNPTALLF